MSDQAETSLTFRPSYCSYILFMKPNVFFFFLIPASSVLQSITFSPTNRELLENK